MERVGTLGARAEGMKASGATAAIALVLVAITSAGRGQARLEAASHRGRLGRMHYQVDASKSRLVIETHTTGLSSMFGHDHEIAARRFAGAISFVAGAPETLSLDLTVRADSLALLDKDVSEPDRRDIERAIRKALDTARSPQISFHASGATAESIGPEVFQVEITGELRLHGVRNELTIRGQVIVQADGVRVSGACKVRQTDYNIVPISFANGTVGVDDEITVRFDLVAPSTPER